MRASPRSLLTVVLLGVAAAVPAFAQVGSAPSAPLTQYPACTGKPSQADTEAAHGAYTAGKGSFDEADYTTAINYFKDAYRRDCTKHELLIIISRSYELQGNRPEAVNALETYLARVPTAPDAEVQKRHIANLKKEIADQAAASASASAAAAASAAPSAAQSASAVPSASASVAPTASVEPPSSAPITEGHRHTVAPWIVAGGGAAALIVGSVLFVSGSGSVSDAEAVCGPNHNQCPAGSSSINSGNSGRSLETVGVVVGGVGLGAVAAGLLWHFLEPTGPSASTTTGRPMLVPQIGPGYAGAGVGGQF